MRVKKYGCPNDGSICPSRTYGSMSRPGPVSGSDEMVPECVALDVHKRTITASYVGSDARTWKFPTTRERIVNELRQYGNMPVVLEASTTGKAVASLLIAEGRELHMAAPNMVAMIAKAQVKTDRRDAETLAHLYRTGFLPDCYVPPPDIEMLRLIVRQRRDIGYKLSLVKNQIHALVSRNLLDTEMTGISDWFGVKGLRRLNALPLPSHERHNMFLYLLQIKSLVGMEEQLQSQLALIAKDRDDARLLMTIPGIHYYTALGIVAEIGDIRRFTTKHQLCSYAALVPRADNSGDRVSRHNHVKNGDIILKSLLCTAVQGMLKSAKETAIARFYWKKEKSIGAAKAQVAAARKLACVVWAMLTSGKPYVEEDRDLTARKKMTMDKHAMKAAAFSEQELLDITELLCTKTEILNRLKEEVGIDQDQVEDKQEE